MEIANLNQSQIDKIKQTESALNSSFNDKNKELILLAYTKYDGSK